MMLLRKITVMAVLGAVGAVVGALLGELLFLGETPPPRPASRQICLLFDISGSMGERVARPDGAGSTTQLEALQDAACDFIARQDLEADAVGLVVFASSAHVVSELSRDAGKLNRAIRGLFCGGGTNLGRGFDVAGSALPDGEDAERWVLVFTDGKPETSSTDEPPGMAALTAARALRNRGIRIVAIGTRLADATLLADATGSGDNVITSDAVELPDAFRRSEEVINRQMLASSGGPGSFSRNVMVTGFWAALIAIGTGVGLVVGQNRYMKRSQITIRQFATVVLGGVIAGLVAGGAGQTAFVALSEAGETTFALSEKVVEAIARVIAWTLLGCGIGYGMGAFVPNLARLKAAGAAAAAGVAGAVGFLLLGDAPGRLLGAAIMGLAIGMMTVLVESVYRTAWLIVHWSPRERSEVVLGSSPILIGSSPEAHVLLPEDSPSVAARVRLADGVVQLEDKRSGETRPVADGESLEFGKLRIEIKAGEGRRDPKPLPSAKPKAKPKRKQKQAPAQSPAGTGTGTARPATAKPGTRWWEGR